MKKIFIFGYFGWKNFGDDVIAYSILESFSDEISKSKFDILLSLKDPYLLQNYKFRDKIQIVNYTIIDLFKAIVSSDIFIFAGGTHFVDIGKISFRKLRNFSMYLTIMMLTKIFKKPLIILGHGIGPLRKWSAYLTKLILKNSKLILVRDIKSYNFLTNIGLEKRSFLGFDCAGVLYDENAITIKENEPPIIGISLIPFYEIYHFNPEKDQNLILNFAKGLKIWLNKLNFRVKLKLFCFRSGKIHSDTRLVESFSELIADNEKIIDIEIIKYNDEIREFVREISKCNKFITMRYHSYVLAYILDIPFISIEYMEKCSYLSEYIKTPDKARITIDEFNDNILVIKLNDLTKNESELKPMIPNKIMYKETKKMFQIVYRFIHRKNN